MEVVKLKYKKDFLKHVLFRIDYKMKDSNSNLFVSDLKQACSNICNVFEEQNSVDIEFKQIGNTSTFEKLDTNNLVWSFHNGTRTKLIALSSKFLFIDESVYEGYAAMKSDFLHVFETICKISQIDVIRLGVRYIDEISIDGIEIAEINTKDFWKKYINSSLISCLDFIEDKREISRVLSQFEYNYEPIKLRYKCGLLNPDYPSPNKKGNFLIDTDVYIEGLIANADIAQHIDDFHKKASTFFEKTITDELRELMQNDEQ